MDMHAPWLASHKGCGIRCSGKSASPAMPAGARVSLLMEYDSLKFSDIKHGAFSMSYTLQDLSKLGETVLLQGCFHIGDSTSCG